MNLSILSQYILREITLFVNRMMTLCDMVLNSSRYSETALLIAAYPSEGP